MNKGKFITFEGGEGAGKSTQARLLWQRLSRVKIPAELTREPGGTRFAEAVRGVLLDSAYSYRSELAELLLFYGARADHLERRIVPALDEGTWIICDRFSDSTRAYQGVAGGLDRRIIDAVEQMVVGNRGPNLTIILDIDPEIGAKRAIRRAYGAVNSQSRLFEPEQLAFSFAPDRFEALDVAFHRRVREAFLSIARDEPERCVVVQGAGGITKVAEQVWECVTERLSIPILGRKSVAS